MSSGAVTAEVPHLGAQEPASALLEALDQVGAVIVEGMIDRAEIEAVVTELEPWLDSPPREQGFVNDGVELFFSGVRHVTGLSAKSPTFIESLLLNPVMLALADQWFDPVSSAYQLNIAHLLVRDPGSGRQLWHRDEDVWVHLQQMLAGVEPHPEVQLAAITALVDFTDDIGATEVVPGSHRWERGRQPEEHEVAVATMPAGSAVIYRGSVIHAGGANRSDRARPGIHHSYVVGWLRTEESGILAALPEVARDLPERAQELVGYGCHDAIEELGGYLGVVELQDPVELLRDGTLGRGG